MKPDIKSKTVPKLEQQAVMKFDGAGEAQHS